MVPRYPTYQVALNSERQYHELTVENGVCFKKIIYIYKYNSGLSAYNLINFN